MMKPLQVTVNRRLWLRGEGEGDSYLLRERDGKMCCMGFACIAAGIPSDAISGYLVVSDLKQDGDLLYVKELQVFAPGFHAYITDSVEKSIYSVNDDEDIGKADNFQRETELIRLGKEVGIAFTFVD